MKRILFIAFLLIGMSRTYAGDMSNSIEYSQLYIIGEATEASWDLGKAPGLTRISDGVFEWTGKLEGGKEFKFINTREFHKHIVSAKATPTIEIGKTYPLNFFANRGLPNEQDLKFKIVETGEYTIIVDLQSMRMAVKPKVNAITYPDKFYATGSALDNKVIELHNMNSIEFKDVLSLKPGHLKLMNTPEETETTMYYVPRFEDVDITFGLGYNTSLQSSKDSLLKGWSITLAGDYTLYIGINDSHSAYARLFKPCKVLYLVGGCCEFAWNYWDESNCLFVPNPNNPEEMVWEGELRQGWESQINPDANTNEPNKFKILTAADWNSETYHPYIEDSAAEGESDARITGGADWKWSISRDGKYRLTLNTKTEILRCEYLGMAEETTNEKVNSNISDKCVRQVSAITVYTNANAIMVRSSNEPVDVNVYTLNGNIIAKATNVKDDIVASDLIAGIYVINTKGKSVNETKKIIVVN